MCRRFARLPFFATLVAVAGCVEPLPPTRPVANPTLPASQLAIVELPGDGAQVDSISVGNRQLYLRTRDNPEYRKTSVELSPGRYTFRYDVNCNAMAPLALTSTLALEAGHRYQAAGDCCYWWTDRYGCSYLWGSYLGRYQAFLWFEDLTTGAVLDGRRMEDPTAHASKPPSNPP